MKSKPLVVMLLVFWVTASASPPATEPTATAARPNVLFLFADDHHGKRGNTAPLIQARFEISKYLKDDLGDRTDGEPGRQIVDEAIGFLKEREDKKDARPFFN